MSRVLALLTSVAGLSACAIEPGVPHCDGRVTVRVGEGLKPTISWTPACRLSGLTVDVDSAGQYWHRWVVSAGSSSIGPSVTYGRTPDDAHTTFGPIPLERGRHYRVDVTWRQLVDFGSSITYVAGQLDFYR